MGVIIMNNEYKIQSNFGKRLQMELDKRQWKVNDLVRVLEPYRTEGIENRGNTIRQWIKGPNKPNIDTMLDVCSVLGCTPDYLLGFDDCTNKSYQYIANETGLTELAINHFHSRLKNTDYHCSASVRLNKSDKKEFEKAISEKEQKNIDSFNQVLCRIDLMGFCSSLLEYAQSKSEISNSKEYWDNFNSALSKGIDYKKTPPKDLINYSEYVNIQERQAYKMFLLKEELSNMVDLLTQSLIEYPIKND